MLSAFNGCMKKIFNKADAMDSYLWKSTKGDNIEFVYTVIYEVIIESNLAPNVCALDMSVQELCKTGCKDGVNLLFQRFHCIILPYFLNQLLVSMMA